MPDKSLVVNSFKYGLDTRREILASMPGTLQTLQNAFINSGGEIEKRRAFVLLGTLPTGANGFKPQGYQDTDTGIMVFSDSPSPGGLPTNHVWQQLAYPSSSAPGSISLVFFSTAFKGKAFVLVNFDNELATFAYYNGTIVYQITDGVVLLHPGGGGTPETISDLSTDLAAIVNRITGWLAHANVTAGAPNPSGYNESALNGSTLIMSPPGIHFTPVIQNKSTVSGLLGAKLLDQNYAGIGAVAAATAFQLATGTNGTVEVSAPAAADGTGSISLTNGTVAFNSTLLQTSTDIVTAINNYTFVSGYSAIRVISGGVATITVYAPTSFGNFTFNLTVTCTGDITSSGGTIGRVFTAQLTPQSNVDSAVNVQGNGYFDVYGYIGLAVTGASLTPTITWTKLTGTLNSNDPQDNIIFSTDGWTTVGPIDSPITGISVAFHARIQAGTTIEANFKCVAHNGVDPDFRQGFFVRLSVNH